MGSSRLQAFFQRARDPRTFWLHVYGSPEGPVFVGAHRLHPNQVVTLPVLAQAGWGRDQRVPPVISAGARDAMQCPALIDTSSKESWADFAAATELGMTPLGPPAHVRTPQHVRDMAEGYLCVLPTLRIGELRVETALFYAQTLDGPLGALARDARAPRPRLVLGCDLLGALRYFQIDYGQSALTLSSTIPYRPPERRLVATVPLERTNGVIAAKGFLDGVPTVFLMDTAGDYELATQNPQVPVARQVTVGDLVMRDVPVTSLEALGLGLPDYPRIGRRALGKFKVTFDCKLGLIYFERPERS